MALTEDDVRGIAAEMTAYLNDAVDMLEPILAYNLPDVDPTFHPIGSLSNVMRDDAVDADRAFTIDEALGNAGSSRDRSFRVPSILGEEE